MAFSPTSNDQRNFECVTVASVDFIKLPLKDILESLIQPVDLFKGINSCPALLSGKYKLRQDQLKLCFIQPKAIPDYSKFDVTLLYTLIRNLCPSLKPTKGWGKDPDDADIQIGDDIERLRLFRNNYHAHADSAAISDANFKDIWKNLKSVVHRIQKYMYNTGRNVNYEQELIKMESSKIAQDHLESCKLLLQALMNIQQLTAIKDEPEIFLKGEDRVICGGTARFEANARNVDFSCWRFTWQKRTGNSTERIDKNQEKYEGSANITLLIQNVSKEDEGEYKAVLSREANGIEYKISSNTVYLHALGELPILNDLRVTTEDEGITIHYSYKVLKQSPEVKHIDWCKNGEPLDRKSEKYIGGSLNENCFTIKSPTDEDRGKYSCTITNAVGSVSKSVIFGRPNITTSEETVIRTKSVKLVGDVFVYDGSPDILEVFWTKNGEKIDTQGSGGRLSAVTVDDPSLTIRDVSHTDAGEYKLIARNAVGTTSSDIIAIGVPNVKLEGLENEESGIHCFRATIKATPSPYSVQWSKKGNYEDEFKPLDADAEEFKGTTNNLPHPKLVVKDRNLLENNCFQIEVSNFVGYTIEKISGL